MANLFVKIGADDSEQQKVLKRSIKAWEAYGKTLEQIGRKLTGSLTVPIAGMEAAVFAFSDKAKAAFSDFGASVKASMGRVGDSIARSINLEGMLKGVASSVQAVTDAFANLPSVVQTAIIALATFTAAIGPALLMTGKLIVAFQAMRALLVGPAGIAILIGAAVAGLAAYGIASAYAASGTAKLGAELDKEIARLHEKIRLNEYIARIGLGMERMTAEAEIARAQTDIIKTRVDALAEYSKRYAAAIREMEFAAKGLTTPEGGSPVRTGPGLAGAGTGAISESIRLSAEEASKRFDQAKAAAAAYQAEIAKIQDSESKYYVDVEKVSEALRRRDDLFRESTNRAQNYSDTIAKTATIEERQAFKVDLQKQQLSKLMALYDEMANKHLPRESEEFKKLTEQINAANDALRRQQQELDTVKAKAAFDRSATMFGIQGGGINMVEQARGGLMDQYSKGMIAGLPETGQYMKDLRSDIESLQTPWMTFIGLVQASTPVWQQMGELLKGIVDQFASGVGNAVAQVLIYGASLAKTAIALLKQLAAYVIQTLVQIGINWLIAQVAKKVGYLTELIAGLKTYAALTYATVYAANAGIPLVGPIVAKGIASAAVAAMLGGAAGAGSLGAAAGAGMGAAAEGGIFTSPGVTRIAERGQPEIVLNEENIRRFFPMLAGGRQVTQNIEVKLDERVLARATARGLPEILRLHGAI